MNGKNDFSYTAFGKSILFYCVIIILCAVFALYVKSFALFAALLVLAAAMMVHAAIERTVRAKKSAEYIDSMLFMSENSDVSISQTVPIPMLSVAPDSSVCWYNEAFRKAFANAEIGRSVESVLPNMKIKELLGGEYIYRTEGGEVYKVKAATLNNALLLTFTDITEAEICKKLLEDQKNVIAVINIDNYEEAIEAAPDAVRQSLLSEIERAVTAWVREKNGIIRKLERDRYLCVFDGAALLAFTEERFAVLDCVRSAGREQKIPPTISIGIGADGGTLADNEEYAKAALDMALGRGGDQVVVRDRANFSYFGGKSKEVEKRTRVKARVMATALRGLISNSSNVMVVCHRLADADSLGACLGVVCAAQSCGKMCRVYFESCDTTVAGMLKSAEKSGTEGVFLNKQAAREYFQKDTLLVVCDTHKPSMVGGKEFLDDAKSVVLIDHHRRSEEFLRHTDLVYHEPFASSASEMITEVLQYIDPRISLNTFTAEALYAGIVIDTNNFTVKTGVRTFEAAAYLRAAGVDTIRIKRLFQESMDDYETKYRIVSEAVIYRDNIAISKADFVCEKDIVAKSAEELLEISGVAASFVVAKDRDGSSVSGRSLGDINVQMILERLGGGGHMLSGAAQQSGVSVLECEERLKEAIDEYLDSLS
ncbi:MAG: DHH family phosphoesterase [Clostridia bacterium]|nr:DHH family phosphoesterase [Clostridia bacterium]